MSDRLSKAKKWIAENKKTIIIACVSIATVAVGAVIFTKNKNTIINTTKTLINKIKSLSLIKQLNGTKKVTPNIHNSIIDIPPLIYNIASETTINETPPITYNISSNAYSMGDTQIFKDNSTEKKIIYVNKHIRNLSGNRHASALKLQQAIENGFYIGENQTWVESYTKNAG